MSVLSRIAYLQKRRDEEPNKQLARELAETKDAEGIREIAANLRNKNPNIQGNCVNVLYWVGCLSPELIAGYAGDLLELLKSRNNRLVWGSMLALSTIADIQADKLYEHRGEIKRAMEHGSVITVDGAVKTLAILASKDEQRRSDLLPYLLTHLENCRAKSVPQYAESIAVAVDGKTKQAFIEVLEKRIPDLTGQQATRVKKVIREAGKRQ